MEDDVVNSYNYVRADSLNFASVEFFALLTAVCIFLFFSRRRLIDAIVIFLPFSDQVYRVFDLQPLDFLAAAYCLANFGVYRRKKKLPMALLAVPLLFFASLNGWLRSGDFFGFMYSARFLLVAVFAETLSMRHWRSEDLEYFLRLYRRVFVFSVFVLFTQVVLWFAGLPIAGIFYQVGLIRAKGLAHEPSTFGIWLVFSVPFLFCYHRRYASSFWAKFFTVFAFLVGMLFTSSLLAMVSLAAMVAVLLVMNAKDRPMDLVAGVISVAFVLGAAGVLFGNQIEEVMLPKIGNYVNEMLDPNAADESGRGGDRQLIRLFLDNQLFGIGAFRSSKLFENAEVRDVFVYDFVPAANTLITTLAEFGLVGALYWLSLLILLLINLVSRVTYDGRVFFAAVAAWGVALIGARLLAFYQPWIIVSFILVFYSLRQGRSDS